MTDDVVAGAPVLYPAQTFAGSQVVHLARSEARRGGPPVLLGICTPLLDIELDRAEAPRRWWWRRRVRWCGDCARYRAYLIGQGQL